MNHFVSNTKCPNCENQAFYCVKDNVRKEPVATIITVADAGDAMKGNAFFPQNIPVI